MSEADALLAAIRQAPDDDAPRLIYADWLDEHSQPERAEFIRIQIELAQSESEELRKREFDLLAEHHDSFAGDLASPSRRYVFERGFPRYFGHTGVYVLSMARRASANNLMLQFGPMGYVGWQATSLPAADWIEDEIRRRAAVSEFDRTGSLPFESEPLDPAPHELVVAQFELEAIQNPHLISFSYLMPEALGKKPEGARFEGEDLVLFGRQRLLRGRSERRFEHFDSSRLSSWPIEERCPSTSLDESKPS